jgi:membrane protein YdbS with pleckstrin-like domain
MASESPVWSGSPSQITNLGVYMLCALLSLTVVLAVVAIPYAIWRYLVLKNNVVELTSQRLITHSGVLSKHTDELELYRVRDTKFAQSFFLRIFCLGNVILVTADATTPLVTIKAVKDAQKLREQIRFLVEARRDQKRVRVGEFE